MTVHTILLADDSDFLRAMLEQLLVRAKVCEHVIGCEDGTHVLEQATREFIADAPIELYCLDLQMPVMGGQTAALALRAIERGFGRAPAPILFFTAIPLDETLQRLVDFCHPAHYINKREISPEILVDKLRAALPQLLARAGDA